MVLSHCKSLHTPPLIKYTLNACDEIQLTIKGNFLCQLTGYIPIRRSSSHLTPCCPLATSEKPIVAPTMQCVPEMGSLRKEAASCHTAEPNQNTFMTSVAWCHNFSFYTVKTGTKNILQPDSPLLQCIFTSLISTSNALSTLTDSSNYMKDKLQILTNHCADRSSHQDMFRAVVHAHINDSLANSFTHFGPKKHRPQGLKHRC